MAAPFMYDEESFYQDIMMRRAGGPGRRFDEYYRCYPIAMLPGPERESVNYGGKVFLPASALEKLTRLHISYPMLFEIINGAKECTSHAGVLEFIAEEGKIYLPYWLMQTLLLEPGDLVQIKSTDLPAGTFIKLEPQSTEFLEISDPKAVLENAFRNFSCLTVGDIFQFSYNDTVYDIAVLEVKPDLGTHAIYTMETDLSVDFAPPKGYVEPEKNGSTTAGGPKPLGGQIQPQGSMAQRINYSAIAPSATTVTAGAKAAASHFLSEGNKLGSSRRNSAKSTPGTSTPVGGAVTAPIRTAPHNGPQPLRLPPNTLFFGYEYKPPTKRNAEGQNIEDAPKPRFQGMGQTLRGKKVEAAPEPADVDMGNTSTDGQKIGRRLRD